MSMHVSSVEGLIEALQNIKRTYGNLPIQVNAIGTPCVTGLTSVCVDDDMGGDIPIVYIETVVDDKVYTPTFNVYSQSGKEV